MEDNWGTTKKSGSKPSGFSVNAYGITKISDLEIGLREPIKNVKNEIIGYTLDYISLWEYIELVL
jgi:hypothetical protein